MRIAFDAKRYFKNKTGLGNYSRVIVHALAKKFPEHEFLLVHNENIAPFIDLPNLKTLAFAGKGSFWRVFGMASDLKKNGIDIYHGLSNEIPTGLNKNGIRSVVTIHDAIFMRYPGYYSFIDRFIYRLKSKYAVANATHIVATSQCTAADLQEYFQAKPDKISVVYQPVNPDFYTHVRTEIPEIKVPYFIYVSSFTRRKNHGALIQAFARIQKMTDWNLVLVGSGKETLAEVKQFIENEKLQERITIIENAKESELINRMQNASAFIYPSFFEGFGIPLAEAAVSKLPVAASNIAVFTELAEDAAIYFHPNKYEEIADAMLRLTNKDLTAKMVLKDDMILQKIIPEKIAAQLMEIYSKGV